MKKAESIQEIKNLLFSLAKRFTETQYMENMRGNKQVASTPEGYSVTVSLSMAETSFGGLYPADEVEAAIHSLIEESSPEWDELGVSLDFDEKYEARAIRFSRMLNSDEYQAHNERKALSVQDGLIRRIMASADEYRDSSKTGPWPNFKDWLKRFTSEEIDMWMFSSSFKKQ